MKDKHELITLSEKAWWSSLLGILKYQGNLMRSLYRSEKQMHNEHKLITQDEQVRLENLKFQGNLIRCFRATVGRVRTRFPKETEVTSRETDSRVVSILLLNVLTRQMFGNLFLVGTRIICFIKRALNWWSRNIKGDLLTVASMNFSNKLMLKDWNWRTPITDILNLEENSYACKKNYLWSK